MDIKTATGLARCRKCVTVIDRCSLVQIGSVNGRNSQWFHAECYAANKNKHPFYDTASSLRGYNKLSQAQQQVAIDAFLKQEKKEEEDEKKLLNGGIICFDNDYLKKNFTKPELIEIMKTYGLKVNGKKDELISRIDNNRILILYNILINLKIFEQLQFPNGLLFLISRYSYENNTFVSSNNGDHDMNRLIRENPNVAKAMKQKMFFICMSSSTSDKNNNNHKNGNQIRLPPLLKKKKDDKRFSRMFWKSKNRNSDSNSNTNNSNFSLHSNKEKTHQRELIFNVNKSNNKLKDNEKNETDCQPPPKKKRKIYKYEYKY